MDAKSLLQAGERLFSKRGSLMSLWQEIADNFYPERADFTYRRSVGDEFADHLQTSYTILARRTLGNAFAGMLRRDNWFAIRASDEDREDQESQAWLEWATQTQHRAMYDPKANFVRATKEGDQDFAAFGMAVLSVELSRNMDRFLYRNWHLRDVAWCENYDGSIGPVHRRWKPFAVDVVKMFKNPHPDVIQRAEKNPYMEVPCEHVMMPSDLVGDGHRQPYISYYVDREHTHVMQATPTHNKMYVIPRWQTVSGSQYAYSPATIAALPDARMIQAITLTLLEAGEWAVSPPLLGTKEAIRSDLALYSRGVTWVSPDYDERMGAALKPLDMPKQGLPFGLEMSDRVAALINEVFFLSDLKLPPPGKDMTAYEISERIREWIRNALPIFEPIEETYNAALCELTFDIGLRAGLFGSIDAIPDQLKGENVRFRFESPIREATEQIKGQKLIQGKQLLMEAAELDPTALVELNARLALRDALTGIGVPAKWRPTEDEADRLAEEAQSRQQMIDAIQTGSQVAQAAKAGAEGERAMAQAV